MPEYRDQVDALASMMEEFHLGEASLTIEGLHVSFKRFSASSAALESGAESPAVSAPVVVQPPEPAKPAGTPVTSPMNGIFYDAPSPSSAPFVKVGDSVSAGQIVGLIEAMKVFNEIPCAFGGTVLELVAESGSIVQPGDVLLYVG